MSFDHWLAFAAASAVMLAIPGPTILLVISYALGHGRRTAGATVATSVSACTVMRPGAESVRSPSATRSSMPAPLPRPEAKRASAAG